ncbi:hypothetical protein DL93DRAFT_2226794 [Clavulina sp. PMI_390]|nr:hypothetical protein DL93DRAFT_2226794 [Clavulina sp. PMI_390]
MRPRVAILTLAAASVFSLASATPVARDFPIDQLREVINGSRWPLRMQRTQLFLIFNNSKSRLITFLVYCRPWVLIFVRGPLQQ